MRNKSKINVMHTVLSLETGGLERMVAETALTIDKNHFNVEVCCFDRFGEFKSNLDLENITVTLLKRNQNRYDYYYPIKLRKLLAEKNIDILHMHNGTFFLGTQAGILARTPVMIYTEHGRPMVESKIEILLDRISGIFVDKIITVSKELEKYIVNKIKIPRKKVVTIINGINTDIFTFRNKPLALMNEFGITQNDKVIGTVGRLAEVKDQFSLIEAFKFVHQKMPNTFLLLVGDGPLRGRLCEKINESKFGEHIKILGNRNDVSDIINLFDVFVLSSLSEGTSVALLEAMSSSVVPIVTAVGGNPSIVDNKINGVLVRPKNINELAENIIDILILNEKRKQYAENAAIKIRDNYCIKKSVSEYEKLYLESINGIL